jgi:site-specific recombinase XerD
MQNTTTIKRKIIADHDIAKLYEHLKGTYSMRLRSVSPMRTLAMCMLMEQTGMRIGEVCALTDSDLVQIDPYRVNVHVPFLPKYTKVGARTVPLITYTIAGNATPAWAAIERWRGLKKRLGIESAFLFCSSSGAQLRPDTVSNYIHKQAKAAGINYPVTAHMFRHTAATKYARKYNNPQLVQKLLGHAHLRTTEVYFHINEDDVAAMLSDSENSAGFTSEEMEILNSDLH